MKLIHNYFPKLSEHQTSQFDMLKPLYEEWNAKINVISRKDIDNLYLHHVLHSLAIAKFIQFKPGTKIIDLGTGGGFPGIPLAILFPECNFTLVDSIRKKITVVQAVAEALELSNVNTQTIRVEEMKEKFDFVVTRAVAKIDQLLPWSRKVLSKTQTNMYPNGLIALKGNMSEEIKLIPKFEYKEIIHIPTYFNEHYFEEKYVFYVQG
ncbi:MAG: 16S rRNA (guanine(527)-N(7))-methyltransferase RsmG [Saprospiraceae bacterium]|nr:16S rRNA (guanine(527)-N(7))-methyltransferase RsmG [Saprospiraceae bacterium]